MLFALAGSGFGAMQRCCAAFRQKPYKNENTPYICF